MRPRIRFVINSLAGGGAERVFSTIAAASRAQADVCDFAVVLLDREEEAYALPDWVRLERLDAGGSLVRSTRDLHALFRRERPDLTLSFLSRANAACVVSAKLLGFRTVISERINTSAHLGDSVRGRVSKAIVRATYPRADHVLANSEGIVDDLVANFGVRRDRASVIMNPVDAAGIRAKGAAEPEIALPPSFIVATGRLTVVKRFADLIRGYAIADPPHALVILGEGPERARLEALVTELGLHDRVSMPGFVRNPYAVMRRAAFAVSASSGEGMPNVLLELLALGVPAVHTNCASGPSEVLANARRETITGVAVVRYGILTPVGDPAALAAGMQMMQDAAVRATYAERGPERVADLDAATIAGRYWATLNATLAGR